MQDSLKIANHGFNRMQKCTVNLFLSYSKCHF